MHVSRSVYTLEGKTNDLKSSGVKITNKMVGRKYPELRIACEDEIASPGTGGRSRGPNKTAGSKGLGNRINAIKYVKSFHIIPVAHDICRPRACKVTKSLSEGLDDQVSPVKRIGPTKQTRQIRGRRVAPE